MAQGTRGFTRRFAGRRKDASVELITDARRSPLEGWHRRRRVYATLQILRLPVLLLAALVMWLTNNVVVTTIIALCSVPLPWVAVLLANETGEVDKQTNNVYKPAQVRQNRIDLNRALHQPRRAQLTARHVEVIDATEVIDAGEVVDDEGQAAPGGAERTDTAGPSASQSPPASPGESDNAH